MFHRKQVEFKSGTDFQVWDNGSDCTLHIGNGIDSGYCEVSLEEIDSLIELLKEFREEMTSGGDIDS